MLASPILESDSVRANSTSLRSVVFLCDRSARSQISVDQILEILLPAGARLRIEIVALDPRGDLAPGRAGRPAFPRPRRDPSRRSARRRSGRARRPRSSPPNHGLSKVPPPNMSRPVADEAVPVADRRAEVVLHALAEDELVAIVIVGRRGDWPIAAPRNGSARCRRKSPCRSLQRLPRRRFSAKIAKMLMYVNQAFSSLARSFYRKRAQFAAGAR